MSIHEQARGAQVLAREDLGALLDSLRSFWGKDEARFGVDALLHIRAALQRIGVLSADRHLPREWGPALARAGAAVPTDLLERAERLLHRGFELTGSPGPHLPWLDLDAVDALALRLCQLLGPRFVDALCVGSSLPFASAAPRLAADVSEHPELARDLALAHAGVRGDPDGRWAAPPKEIVRHLALRCALPNPFDSQPLRRFAWALQPALSAGALHNLFVALDAEESALLKPGAPRWYQRDEGPTGSITFAEAGEPTGRPLSVLLARLRADPRVSLEIALAVADIVTLALEDGQRVLGLTLGDVFVDQEGRVAVGGFEAHPQAAAHEPRTVYALGVLLHTLLGGLFAPDAGTPDEHDEAVVDRVLTLDLRAVRDGGKREALRLLLCEMMAFVPSERPSALDAALALAAILPATDGQPLRAWGSLPPAPPPLPPKLPETPAPPAGWLSMQPLASEATSGDDEISADAFFSNHRVFPSLLRAEPGRAEPGRDEPGRAAPTPSPVAAPPVAAPPVAAPPVAAPPDTTPDAPIVAASLQHAVENRFPAPIALVFYQLRQAADWRAELNLLANVLDAALEHLALLALAETLAGREPPPPQWARFLKAPISSGGWRELLFLTLSALPPDPVLRELPTLAALAPNLEELVRLRNQLIKKSGLSGVTREQHRAFKAGVLQFVADLAFLRSYLLVTVEATHSTRGARTHACVAHRGFHPFPLPTRVQCDLDLERGRTYLLAANDTRVLDLSPVLGAAVGERGGWELAWLQGFDGRKASYRTAAGRPDLGREAAMELAARLVAPDTSRRRAARYLHVDALGGDGLLPPGHALGPYTVTAWLGSGGMAEVYAVTDPAGRAFAAKVLPARNLASPTLVARFHREITAARRFRSPHVVPVLDGGDELAHHYFVMELATGWDVGGRVARDAAELRAPLPEATVRSVWKQACEGLAHVHGHGVVHRDIKPSNLLLFAGGVVKLADFGVALAQDGFRMTLTGQPIGTLEYAAPEQMDGRSEIRPTADLYALGVVAFELLTGVLPLDRGAPLATLFARVQEPAPDVRTLAPHVSENLASILARCLARDPADRFPDARALYGALSGAG